MSLNPSIGLVGIAFQKDRDTTATEPTFVHGLTGGSPFGASRSIANTAVACGTRAPSDARVDSIEITPSVQALCYPDTFGAYLYAALGNVVSSKADVDGYYKHVFTMGSTIPYMTIWSQVGVDNFTRADGCKCGTLSLTATGNEHLAMQADFQGIDAEVGIDGMPGSVEASCFSGKYTTTDCTFRLDASGDTPAEALVSEGSFTFENNLSALTSIGRVTPREIAEGNLSAGCSVTTIPDDITEYKKLMTGSETSTALTGKVVLGSVYAKFFHTDDANMTLEIEVNHCPFTADYPEVDPEGNEATIQFSTDAAIIAKQGESPVTVTLVNKTPAYGAADAATGTSINSVSSSSKSASGSKAVSD